MLRARSRNLELKHSKSLSATQLLLALALILIVCGTTTRASTAVCDTPSYIDAGVAEGDRSAHFHPGLMFVVYVRNRQDKQPVHDVTSLIVPPPGVGIDRPKVSNTSEYPEWIYRRVHSHDESGVLHVEPVKGDVLRLCQFLKLWEGSSESNWKLEKYLSGKFAHVRVGEQYNRNIPIEKLLALPLNHNMKIVVFVEKPIDM